MYVAVLVTATVRQKNVKPGKIGDKLNINMNETSL